MAAMNDPLILNDVLDEEDYSQLLLTLANPKQFEYQEWASRYIIGDNNVKFLGELAWKLIPKAREAFNSDNLLPTYTMFAHYEKLGDVAPSLYKHKDDNACTYTLDMCIYQVEPWDLWVEDKNYTLYPNQALAYYGNDQLHWREEFPNPDSNHVAMIFFHYAEPDHWWFVKGPQYLEVIRGNMTEEEFDQIHSTRS
jgi:hypothetical protein